MDLIQLVILLIVIGVLLYCVNAFIPMEPTIKQIINAVVIIAVILFIISLFTGLPSIRVGR